MTPRQDFHRVSRERAGFSLLELIVVVAVLAILMATLLPAVQGMRNRAKQREATSNANALANAIRAFRAEYGYWPTSESNPNSPVLTPDQYTVVKNYLLSTAAAKNTKAVPYWEIDGIVSNMATLRPLTLSIDIVNDSVAVNDRNAN